MTPFHRTIIAAALRACCVQNESQRERITEWRGRLAEWCRAAADFVRQHGGSSEEASPFVTIAYNADLEGDWYEERLLEVAAFVHRRMELFRQSIEVIESRGTTTAALPTTQTAAIAYTSDGWRTWPEPRGAHDNGDGVR